MFALVSLLGTLVPVPEPAASAVVGLAGMSFLSWSIAFRFQFEQLNRRKADLFAEYVRGRRVLEVGVGRGRNVEQLWSPGREIIGLDPVPNPNLRSTRVSSIVPGFAEDMPFDDGEFDAVVCEKVFCQVKDTAKSLSEISRVLKPGGHFVFVEHVAGDGLVLQAQRLMESRHLTTGHHLCRQTDEQFRRAAEHGDMFSALLALDYVNTLTLFPEAPHIVGCLRR